MPYQPTPYVDFAFGYGALSDLTDGSWTNVTTAYPNDLVFDDATISPGRKSEFDTFPSAKATVRFRDRLRILDPSNASSPYVGLLKPRTPIRIRGFINPTSYVRFTGYVDGWPVQSGRFESVVTITAYDAFKIFSRTNLPNIYDYEVLADSPQAYWRLGEETGDRAVDSSPTRADGEYIASPNTRRGQPSVVPYGGDGSVETFGFNYEGVVVIDQNAKVGTYTTGSMSVELWASSNGGTGNGRQDFVRQGEGTYGAAWNLILLPESYNDLLDSSAWLFQQHCDVVRLGLVTPQLLFYWRVPDLSDENSIDHLVAVVTLAGGTITGPGGAFGTLAATPVLYRNGQVVPMGFTEASSGTNAATETFIGAGPLVLENASFAGRLDNVAVYRSALSAARVLEHYEVGTAPWDAETTGVRIGRVLDLIGWPAALRDLDDGEMLCGPAVLDGQTALAYLQKIAEAEQGRLFVSHDGKVTFHQRDRFLTEATETSSQYTFSDDGAGNAVAESPAYAYDERFIYNRASVTREGGNEQIIDQTSSQATYGPITRSLSGLPLKDDRHSRMIADYIVYRYSDPQVRVGEWGLQPELDAASWSGIFGLRIGHRVTVENKPSNTGTQIATDLHLESIEERISPSTWRFTFGGSPVDPNGADYFEWGGDGATQGWGVGIWR